MSTAAAENRNAGRVTDAVLWLLVAACAIAVPLVVSPNPFDAFRLPKVAVFQVFGIAVIAWLVVMLIFRGRDAFAPLLEDRKVLWLTSAIVAWTALTTLVSTSREISARTLLWVVCAAAVFVATYLLARRSRGWWIALVAFLPAIANAVIALLQRADVWNPIYFNKEVALRVRITALIGNPNDVGTYLLFPALAAIAIALTSRDLRWRIGAAAAAIVLTAGMLVTDTVTAVIAFAAACVAMAVTRSRRALLAIIVVGFVGAGTVMVYAPLRTRITGIVSNVRAGNLLEATSLRIVGYATAWEMFKDRPLIGQGPGTYGWWYLPYKMELNERNRALYEVDVNFGEAHNDHLQTLAVAGLPGYALFVAAALLLALITFRGRRRRHDDPRAAFATLFAFPLAVAFAVVSLGQFPLELAPASAVLLHLAAVCRAWSVES